MAAMCQVWFFVTQRQRWSCEDFNNKQKKWSVLFLLAVTSISCQWVHT
jgi:hypothetical protein